VHGRTHVLDPEALSKEALFGVLDPRRLEWTDGVLTLRDVLAGARHWIVRNGDVDPDWAQDLNTVLDDNKLLTLPNGERLAVPDEVRFIVEVDSLRHATLAFVSRCGMVWLSDDTVFAADL
jgi:dynein heavy chain 1